MTLLVEPRLRRPGAPFDEQTSFYWRGPGAGIELIGRGVARRLSGTAGELAALVAEQSIPFDGPAWARPRWFGGLPFDRGRAGMLMLPEELIVRRGEDSHRTRISPGRRDQPFVPSIDGEEEPPACFERRVEEALQAIEDQRLKKVVLARRVARPLAVTPDRLLARLGAAFPTCAIFCLRLDERTLFVGATPERLVRLEAGRVHTAAIAGSAPRDADAGQMLNDPKERAEHQLVVAQIEQALRPHLSDLRRPQTPQVLRLANVQHLITPFEGAALPGRTALDLVDALHPTPAVCGLPGNAAARYLAEREPLERGYYAGPLGWCDAAGDGDFWVALRSALIRDGRLWAYAGAGIVAGSVPAAELAETALKLDAMLGAIR